MTTNDTTKELPPAAERLAALPDPPMGGIRELRNRARRDRIFLILAAMGMALGLVGAAIAFGMRSDWETRANANAGAAARADERAAAAGTQADGARKAAEEANRRLRALGKPTVPIPTVTISQPPISIPDGLTAQQTLAVRGIIASELTHYHPDLTSAQVQQISRVAASLVPKPQDGKTPTVAELTPLAQAAQRAYCSDGRCTPAPGKDGAPGAQGSVGPAPTDEQLRPLIAAQLLTYCAAQTGGSCQGAIGPQGPAGDPGQEGRSVVETECVQDGEHAGEWRITYDRPLPSGALSVYRSGPCRVEIPGGSVRTR